MVMTPHHTCLAAGHFQHLCLPKCLPTAPRLFKIRELFINHWAALKQQQDNITSVRLLSSQQVAAERAIGSVQEYSEMEDEKAHPSACLPACLPACVCVCAWVCVCARVCYVTGSGEKGGQLFVPTPSLWTGSSHQPLRKHNTASLSVACCSHSPFLNRSKV